MSRKDFIIPTKRKIFIWLMFFVFLLIVPFVAMYIGPTLQEGVGMGAFLIVAARGALNFYLYLSKFHLPESINLYITAMFISIIFYVAAAVLDVFYAAVKIKAGKFL